jgi:hypothetical protein
VHGLASIESSAADYIVLARPFYPKTQNHYAMQVVGKMLQNSNATPREITVSRRRQSFRKNRLRHILATWTELLMTRQETNTSIPAEDRVVISLTSELFSLPE